MERGTLVYWVTLHLLPLFFHKLLDLPSKLSSLYIHKYIDFTIKKKKKPDEIIVFENYW